MQVYSKTEIMEQLIANSQNQPKAKYSNATILHMLNAVDNEATFELEPTRSGFAFNRGSLVEEIVKCVLGVASVKAQKGEADIDLTNVNNVAYGLPMYAKKLEVKFATSFASASASTPKTKYVLLITSEGAYIIDTKNHKESKYYSYSIFEGSKVEKLSKILGF